MNEGRKEDRRGRGGKPGICGSCHVTTSSVRCRSKRSQRNREYIKTSRCCGMQTLSQLCWFFVLCDDQWDGDISGMSGRLCTCGSFYDAVSGSDNRHHPPPDLRNFRLMQFFFLSKGTGMTTVLKSAPISSLRESKRNVTVAGRILLGDNVGGLEVILRSIRFQCAGAWIWSGLLRISLYILTCCDLRWISPDASMS